jgi:hypothetical protein
VTHDELANERGEREGGAFRPPSGPVQSRMSAEFAVVYDLPGRAVSLAVQRELSAAVIYPVSFFQSFQIALRGGVKTHFQ